MTKKYVLPVEIEPLNDGSGYLATCEAIQGCLAEGASVAEAMGNLEDVVRVLLELRVQSVSTNSSPSELLDVRVSARFGGGKM